MTSFAPSHPALSTFRARALRFVVRCRAAHPGKAAIRSPDFADNLTAVDRLRRDVAGGLEAWNDVSGRTPVTPDEAMEAVEHAFDYPPSLVEVAQLLAWLATGEVTSKESWPALRPQRAPPGSADA